MSKFFKDIKESIYIKTSSVGDFLTSRDDGTGQEVSNAKMRIRRFLASVGAAGLMLPMMAQGSGNPQPNTSTRDVDANGTTAIEAVQEYMPGLDDANFKSTQVGTFIRVDFLNTAAHIVGAIGGIDLNGNHQLDASEAQRVEYNNGLQAAVVDLASDQTGTAFFNSLVVDPQAGLHMADSRKAYEPSMAARESLFESAIAGVGYNISTLNAPAGETINSFFMLDHKDDHITTAVYNGAAGQPAPANGLVHQTTYISPEGKQLTVTISADRDLNSDGVIQGREASQFYAVSDDASSSVAKNPSGNYTGDLQGHTGTFSLDTKDLGEVAYRMVESDKMQTMEAEIKRSRLTFPKAPGR